MDVVNADEFEQDLEDPIDEVPEYREFRENEGIPHHTGMYVKDVTSLETGEWDRTGQSGAFINLFGMEYVCDLQLHEIEPAGETNALQHLYEEIVYVLRGNGMTVFGGYDETAFEWQEGAMFYLPKNANYRHINASNDESAILVAHTALPQLLHHLQDERIIFDSDHDPWAGQQPGEFYSAEGEKTTSAIHEATYDNSPLAWNAPFIPDVEKFDYIGTWDRTGAIELTMIPLPLAASYAHISNIKAGTYKNAHRHGPGACIFLLSGEGYNLMWREEDDTRVKIDWQKGSLLVPPAGWYHNHFNTREVDARQFVMHSPRYGALARMDGLFAAHSERNVIEYTDEDPGVRELFESELAKNGLESQMPPECYTDPDYTFST